jgi:modified peptide precursor CbpA
MENRMPSKFTTDTNETTVESTTQSTAAMNAQQADAAKPAIIARRGRCEADGVGLSHYILLDRKVSE